ncbi:MAG: hypothetical protein J0L58_20825 [Burkholderiales bacterium]|uniref:nuclear transport factor 2 family protein n=1 Tax=Inhella sp. TaxID=1921806 RepID=UPI001AC95BAC|nr:hypothetical protein [Burkholderiales bacterium]
MRQVLWGGAPGEPLKSSHPALEIKAVARAYMAEYAAGRLGGMAQLMADPFELVEHGEPRLLPTRNRSDREQTLEKLHLFGRQNGITHLELAFDEHFCSGNVVLFRGHVKARGLLPGGSIGYSWRARYACLITVVAGRVSRHEEFCDGLDPEVESEPLLPQRAAASVA